MKHLNAPFRPPFCPNPRCTHHHHARSWLYIKKGFYRRSGDGRVIQRFLCRHCRLSFSEQTFSTTYWLKRPDLLQRLFLHILSCSAYRQIAREFGVSPNCVAGQVQRLGRHCLLFHEALRPKNTPRETLVIDGFETFEFSQYTPVHFHLAVGTSHYWYAFTDSELRRRGRMTPWQKRRRAELEERFGRPDPASIEKEVAALLDLLVPAGHSASIRSDEHPAYRRALRRLPDRRFVHRVTSSKARRTTHNPLFAVNLLDLLIRHSSANHKRETIAFSKRRQSAAERLAILQVWRNYMKSFSERKRDLSPAQRLGILDRRLAVHDVLERRLFPSQIRLPERLARYYRREIPTRRIPNSTPHALRFAF